MHVTGVSDEVVVLLLFVLGSLLFAGYLLLNKLRRPGGPVPADVAREMADGGMDVPRAGEPPAENECPISLEPLAMPLTTTCGHTFSGTPLLDYYDAVCAPRTLRCPMCRTEVNSLMENFRAEEWEADRRDERNTVLARANTFNRRFSGGMGWRERAADVMMGLGRLLTHPPAIADLLSSWSSLRVLLGMAISVIVPLVYLAFPFDLIPEAVFGLFGLVDDLFFVGCAVFVAASLARSFYEQRMLAA